MKLSRRGTLAGALGGIVSAIVPPIPEGRPMPPDYPYPGTVTEVKVAMENPLHRLTELKRLASGNLNEMEETCYTTSCRQVSKYEVLRSVSPQARFFFEHRYEHERRRQNIIDRAVKQLAHYDKTGILQYFA